VTPPLTGPVFDIASTEIDSVSRIIRLGVSPYLDPNGVYAPQLRRSIVFSL